MPQAAGSSVKVHTPAKGGGTRRDAAWWIPAVVVGVLTGLCVLFSAMKPYWADELLSYYLLTDPSWPHMLGAQRDLINSAPVLYFVLGWVWAHLFGGSELSLRLFSSLAFSASFVALWWMLRRVYGTWPASFGSAVAYLGSTLVLAQNVEARSYGLFLLLLVLAGVVYWQTLRRDRATWGLLAGNALVHAAMMNTHYAAGFYSAAVMGAYLVGGMLEHRARGRAMPWRPMAAVVVGWLTFVPAIPTFLHHSEFGRPWGWMGTPSVKELFDSFEYGVASFGLTTLVLVGAWAIMRNRQPEAAAPNQTPGRAEGDGRDERLLLVLAGLLFLVPVVMWAYSRVGTPMFHSRYYFPGVLGWAVLWAHAANRLISAAPSLRAAQWVQRALAMLMVAAAVACLSQYQVRLEPSGEGVEPGDLPIAVEGMHMYLPNVYYARNPNRYYYLLDRASAQAPDAPRSANNDWQILSGLKRHYPNLQIVELDEFLKHHDRFIVLRHGGTQWFDKRLRSNPAYRWQPIGKSGSFVLVERVGTPTMPR